MLEIGNKKFRNLQEQVGYNTEQIDYILSVLDGLNIQDNAVVIDDISEPLTTDELNIVNKEVAFLIYNNQLFIKKNQDSVTAYFDIVFSISGTTVISFATKEIEVTLSNGGLNLVSASFSTYSKSELDTLLSAKASVSYVDTALLLKADLSGANFTGAITAPSIIENMSGYSYTALTKTNVTMENIFCGAVKNGNKLTLVYALNVTRTDTVSGDTQIGYFTVPNDVASKLYPTTIGLYGGYLSASAINVFDSDVSYKTICGYTTKISTNRVYLIVSAVEMNKLTANTKYYLRYEVTFLLSDNLAS